MRTISTYLSKIDVLRERYPHLGFAVYALTPHGVVTFEVHDSGTVYTFTDETEDAAIDRAFPNYFAEDEATQDFNIFD